MNETKKNIFLGAGGHAKVLRDLCEKSGIHIHAIADNSLNKSKFFSDIKFLESESEIFGFPKNEIMLINAIGSIPGNTKRWEVASEMRKNNLEFLTLVHPYTFVSDLTEVLEGVQIMAGSIVQPGVKIGRDTIVNSGVIIDHDCIIEESCHIAPGSVLSGSVHVEKNTHIGTGSKIIQNIRIGENSIIAAGSTVFKDVPPNTTLIQKK